jgi:hypothetical protein
MAALYIEAADRKRLSLDAMQKVVSANEYATSIPAPLYPAPAPKKT